MIPIYFRKMNFAKAVKGKQSRDAILREVDSQSEIELGRHLDPAEKTTLFSKFPPQHVLNRIKQVLVSTYYRYISY